MVLALFLLSLTACGAAPQAPLISPTPLMEQVTPSVQPKTATPAASATPQPAKGFQAPAEQYLPALDEFPPYYDTEVNLATVNLSQNAQLPLPEENMAARAFRNLGFQNATDPQDGIYYRFIYWMLIAPNDLSAQFFYTMSQTQDYIRQAFLVVTPAAIQQSMKEPSQITPENSPCDQASIYYFRSDPYASLRKSKQLPTRNPSGGYDPQRVINAPPDVYLYSVCRVNNGLIVFWGHTPDNYDGNNSPLPESVIEEQVLQFWDKVIQKIR